MHTIISLLISSFAGFATILGGLIIFFKFKNDNIDKFISFCLSFSIAVMIGISITDLIPSSFFNILFTESYIRGIIYCLLTFTIGILIIIPINKLIINSENSLYKLGMLNMVALIIHNFPEGIATFMGSMKDINLGIKLSCAIMFHNIPEGIAIAVPIYYSTQSKKKALLHTFCSGLAEPAGALLAFLFLNKYINNLFIDYVLLFVAGIMISISINEMLPKVLEYKKPKFIYIGLLTGVILIIINHFVF